MQDIILVSGLPRSGTSLMMQMLKRGGIEVLSVAAHCCLAYSQTAPHLTLR